MVLLPAPTLTSSPFPQPTSPPLLCVFGGRTNPARALDDLFLLDLSSGACLSPTVDGPAPARFRHSAVMCGRKMIVFGGKGSPDPEPKPESKFEPARGVDEIPEGEPAVWEANKASESRHVPPNAYSNTRPSREATARASEQPAALHVSGTVCVLDFDSLPLRWKWLPQDDQAPTPRHSHGCALLDTGMFVFGGFGPGSLADSPADDMLYRLDTCSLRWSRLATRGVPPPALYSHALTRVGSALLLSGGIARSSASHLSTLMCLHMPSATWYTPRVRCYLESKFEPTAASISDPDRPLNGNVYGGLQPDSSSVQRAGDTGLTQTTALESRFELKSAGKSQREFSEVGRCAEVPDPVFGLLDPATSANAEAEARAAFFLRCRAMIC